MSSSDDRDPLDDDASARELFVEQVARCDEVGRTADVEDLCRAHPALADELRRLAREHAAVLRRLAGPAPPGPDAREAAAPARLKRRPWPADRYLDRGEIGRGGMGSVRRVWDDDLRRELAMKVLLSAGAGERAASRFLHEAQVTAQLDHPGVVPVHEVGLDADGRPYFTMRLVRGRSLDQVFRLARSGAEGWSLSRALGVLVRVCETVAFAHARGVVHRDLKPANVMVGPFGEVYVMDWGLARVLGSGERDAADSGPAPLFTDRVEAARTDDSPVRTQRGDIVGTPVYLAPEVAAGGSFDAGPSTDLYSLGAMLYTLLTGVGPYLGGDRRPSSRAVLENVLSGPPTPVHALDPSAPAELVAVCDRAMARAPERRYPDPMELAEDLRAYLDVRVVRAYEQGALAQLRKWVRRNRTAALAGGVALLAVLGGALAFGLSESRAARRDREQTARLQEANLAERAQRERAVARVVDVRELAGTMISDVYDQVSTLEGATPVRREIVDIVLRYLEGLERDAADDPRIREELARGYMRAGTLLGDPGGPNLGDYAGARASHEKAIALLTELVQATPERRDLTYALAQAHGTLGGTLMVLGLAAEAASEVSTAEGLARDLLAEDPSDEAARYLLLTCSVTRGNIENVAGRDQAALAVLDVAAKQARAWFESNPDSGRAAYVLDLLDAGRVKALVRLGRFPEALAALEEEQAAADAGVRLQPENALRRRDAAQVLNFRGYVLLQSGDADGALERYREFRDRMAELCALDPDNVSDAVKLSEAESLIGNALFALQRSPEALEWWQKSFASAQQVAARAPADQGVKTQLALLHQRLAMVLAGRPDELDAAFEHARDSLRLFRELQSADPDDWQTRNGVANQLEWLASRTARLAHDAERPAAERLAHLRDALDLQRECVEAIEAGLELDAFGADGAERLARARRNVTALEQELADATATESED